MCRYSALQQLGQRIPVDVSIDLQQGVTFALVLRQGQPAAPLPTFTGRLIEEVLESWRKWGVLEKDKKKIQDHLTIV